MSGQKSIGWRDTTDVSSRRPYRLLGVLTTAVAAALCLAACAGSAKGTSPSATTQPTATFAASSTALTGGINIKGDKVLFEIYDVPSDSFWIPAKEGAAAAAAVTGLHVVTEYGNSDDTTEANDMSVAVTSHYKGIAAGIPDSGLGKAVCAAQSKGVPVIAFNVDGTTGSSQSCIDAFVGEDHQAAGVVLAKRMVADGMIKKGGSVFCPAEFPTASYAVGRSAGINSVLKPLGLHCNILGTTTDLATVRSTETQYLLGHHNTTAIIGLGSNVSQEAPAAAAAAHISVPIAGFDLNPTIIQSIKSGKAELAADEQPYSQGFYSIMELALYLKYGLKPASLDTGGNLVDKSNITSVAALSPTFR